MLGRLQQQLNDTYQIDSGYDVRDFLITDPHLANALGGDTARTSAGETLLIAEDDDGLSMSLYLEDQVLARLGSGNPIDALQKDQLDDLCKVIEGLSHFNYVAWRASRDRSVSLLELELQDRQ